MSTETMTRTHYTHWISGSKAGIILGIDPATVRRMALAGAIRHRILPGIDTYQYDMLDCERIERQSVREPVAK